jgi:poly-gamma-glutamate capsule biosynthesis protein CapA/YwtB (metallophosphatase superfamily)
MISQSITLFLCGDVMTGRGIDQVLPHPSEPTIYERYMTSAVGYVDLAERTSGPIPLPTNFSYIWGDVLPELEARSPDRRIVNLETSITTSDDVLLKGINYRMHPRNIPCLLVARIDCCVLANNHILDWGICGLIETLESLKHAGIATCGAGLGSAEAAQPAALDVRGEAKVLVFSFGSPTSGIPHSWAASEGQPGINLVPELSKNMACQIADQIDAQRRPGDLVIASIHWGGNWGYEIPKGQRELARQLIDAGAVDVVHGHSSHHPKGIEVYRGRLIIYGCGDFLTDYEGIPGYEEFRSYLSLAYFATLHIQSGSLVRLEMVPFLTRRFRLERAPKLEAQWLRQMLNREGADLGTSVDLTLDGSLRLQW